MSSSRLPGKALLMIAGVPAIVHTLRRVAASESVDEVVMATSTESEDVELVRVTAEAGFDTFTGPLNDVLARTLGAARFFGADHVVRIPGDKPLVDSGEIARVVKQHLLKGSDYTSNLTRNHPNDRRIPLGLEVEVFRLGALERALSMGLVSLQDREHVTSVFYNNPSVFKIASTFSRQYETYSQFRMNLDVAEDFHFFQVAAMKCGFPASSLDFLKWLSDNPAVSKINSNVTQAPMPK